jgi:hypothetical protein
VKLYSQTYLAVTEGLFGWFLLSIFSVSLIGQTWGNEYKNSRVNKPCQIFVVNLFLFQKM